MGLDVLTLSAAKSYTKDEVVSKAGEPSGFATLDPTGRIPYSQLPESAMEYKGTWNAATNTPHLENNVGTHGDFYVVAVGGKWGEYTGDDAFQSDDKILYDGGQRKWLRLLSGDISGVKRDVSTLQTQMATTIKNSQVGVANGVASLDQNGKLRSSQAPNVSWGDVSGKPNTFVPSSHSHIVSDISNFPTSMPPTAHSHTKSDISDFPTSMTPTEHTHTKSEITDFPVSMPPTAHTHQASDIEGLSTTVSWDDVTNKPTSFTPSSHEHTKSDISDFPSTMPPSSHTHTKSEISDFPTSMTPTSHTHAKSQITDFPTSMTPTSHNQAASTITAGTLGGRVQANATAASTLGNAQVRDIYAGTSDMTAGTTSLTTGTIYIMYE